MTHMRYIVRHAMLLSLAVSLAACGKSPENAPPVPAAVTALAPATVPAPSTTPAAASVPAATPAAATGSTAAPSAVSDEGPEIAGSVAVAQGDVTDTAQDGSHRQLKDGDNVYPGDSFTVGDASYLDIDFEDGGRILLRPNTSFQITSFHYDADAHATVAPTDASGQPLIKPASPQPENAFFRLVKGGLRAVDGLIGHSEPQNYGVVTPVATIGVRGTTFDVRYCGDDCQDEADSTGAPANGLYTAVDDGSIGVKNDAGVVVNKAGDYGYVATRHAALMRKHHPPRALRHMRLPEKLKARADKNRKLIEQRRQQRRQRILERRRQAAERAKTAGKAKAQVKIPQARRERRQEKGRGAAKPSAADRATRLKQREQRRDEREQKQTAAPVPGRHVGAERGAGGNQEPTPRERLHEQRQERQQQREQKRKEQAAPSPGKNEKHDKQGKRDEARCKAKRRRSKDEHEKDKDKGQCGGG